MFTCSELPFVFRHYPIHIVLCMEHVVWRTASLIEMQMYSDSYLINISVCFIMWCIISFRFQYFPASCAERNLNPIETEKNIWIPGLMNGCGSCVLSSSPRWKKKKSPRRMSDFRVHVTDSHMAEKIILSNGLLSDLISSPRLWVLVSRVLQGIPEADRAKFLEDWCGCAG